MNHFVLDARTATPHFPGIGRYVTNIVRAMAAQLEQGEMLTVVHPPSAGSGFAPLAGPQVRLQVSDVSPFSIQQQLQIPRLLRQMTTAPTLYHSPYYLMPYNLSLPVVLTFYDVIPLRYPDTVSRRAVAMKAVVKHGDCHRWIPGHRLHHDVINVGLRRASASGAIADELETELEIVCELGCKEVVVIQLKHTVRRAGQSAGTRIPCRATIRRNLENPAQPCGHADIPSVEFHIARETCCIDRIRCRHHRLCGSGRTLAEL